MFGSYQQAIDILSRIRDRTDSKTGQHWLSMCIRVLKHEQAQEESEFNKHYEREIAEAELQRIPERKIN